MKKPGTHRAMQLAALMDRARDERVLNYIRAGRAESLDNFSCAAYFTLRAQRFERIRQACARRLFSAN